MAMAMQHEHDNLYRLDIGGLALKKDFVRFQDALVQEIRRIGPVRLLFVLTAFEGWEPHEDWSDSELLHQARRQHRAHRHRRGREVASRNHDVRGRRPAEGSRGVLPPERHRTRPGLAVSLSVPHAVALSPQRRQHARPSGRQLDVEGLERDVHEAVVPDEAGQRSITPFCPKISAAF